MPKGKSFLICIGLLVLAFAAGYGLQYTKARQAQKEWAEAKGEMQSKISQLESELARARTREALREMSETFSRLIQNLSEKNFGLALKMVDSLKETFGAVQPNLDEEGKTKFSFLAPGLEEIRKDAESLNLNAGKKAEDLKALFEQALKPAPKGREEKKG